MTESFSDPATEYVQIAERACRRRLVLLEDALKRGVHSPEEYQRLRVLTIKEQEQAWDVSLSDLL